MLNLKEIMREMTIGQVDVEILYRGMDSQYILPVLRAKTIYEKRTKGDPRWVSLTQDGNKAFDFGDCVIGWDYKAIDKNNKLVVVEYEIDFFEDNPEIAEYVGMPDGVENIKYYIEHMATDHYFDQYVEEHEIITSAIKEIEGGEAWNDESEKQKTLGLWEQLDEEDDKLLWLIKEKHIELNARGEVIKIAEEFEDYGLRKILNHTMQVDLDSYIKQFESEEEVIATEGLYFDYDSIVEINIVDAHMDQKKLYEDIVALGIDEDIIKTTYYGAKKQTK